MYSSSFWKGGEERLCVCVWQGGFCFLKFCFWKGRNWFEMVAEVGVCCSGGGNAGCCEGGGKVEVVERKGDLYDVKRKRVVSRIVSEVVRLYERGEVINIQKLKSNAAKEYSLPDHPKLTEIIAAIPESHAESLLPLLKAKPVRTASGIAVVAVMSKPHR